MNPIFPFLHYPFITNRGPDDLFVLALSPDLTTMVYSSYLGGCSQEERSSLAIDPQGDVWVPARTLSTDLPVRGA